MDKPPDPFIAMTGLTSGPESIGQAAALTQALAAVPALQSWLREERQRVIRTLHDRDKISYKDMAPALGILPERVSGIARGHSRSTASRRPGSTE